MIIKKITLFSMSFTNIKFSYWLGCTFSYNKMLCKSGKLSGIFGIVDNLA